MAALRLSILLLGLFGCVSFAVSMEDGVVMLAEEGVTPGSAEEPIKVEAPRVRLSEKDNAKMDKIMSVKDLKRLIGKEVDEPERKMEKEENGEYTAGSVADVQDEELAIGNTLRNMEAKEAVKDELLAESPVDCEMGEWSSFDKCSKRCGGGKKTRTRAILRGSAHGGKKCRSLSHTIKCNTQSCAMEEEENFEEARHLTKLEHDKEKAANSELVGEAMKSKSTEGMWQRIRSFMRAAVKTEMVVVKPPNSNMDPEKYEIQQILKKAMAKNAMADAMKIANPTAAPEPTQEEIEGKPGGK